MNTLIDTSSITSKFNDNSATALKIKNNIGNLAKSPDISSVKISSEIKKVSENFEEMVMGFFFKLMFKDVGVGKDSSFGGGFGEEMYSSMLIDEYGKAVSQSGGLGIADMVQKQLLQNQSIPLFKSNTVNNNE